MKKRFQNSYELAHYLIHENTDTRQWGQLKPFSNSPIWDKFFWEMQDKYVRGQPCGHWVFSQEYNECLVQCTSAFVDFINDSGLTFPLFYECICAEATGYSTYFDVTYTPDDQISFIKSYQ